MTYQNTTEFRDDFVQKAKESITAKTLTSTGDSALLVSGALYKMVADVSSAQFIKAGSIAGLETMSSAELESYVSDSNNRTGFIAAVNDVTSATAIAYSNNALLAIAGSATARSIFLNSTTAVNTVKVVPAACVTLVTVADFVTDIVTSNNTALLGNSNFITAVSNNAPAVTILSNNAAALATVRTSGTGAPLVSNSVAWNIIKTSVISITNLFSPTDATSCGWLAAVPAVYDDIVESTLWHNNLFTGSSTLTTANAGIITLFSNATLRTKILANSLARQAVFSNAATQAAILTAGSTVLNELKANTAAYNDFFSSAATPNILASEVNTANVINIFWQSPASSGSVLSKVVLNNTVLTAYLANSSFSSGIVGSADRIAVVMSDATAFNTCLSNASFLSSFPSATAGTIAVINASQGLIDALLSKEAFINSLTSNHTYVCNWLYNSSLIRTSFLSNQTFCRYLSYRIFYAGYAPHTVLNTYSGYTVAGVTPTRYLTEELFDSDMLMSEVTAALVNGISLPTYVGTVTASSCSSYIRNYWLANYSNWNTQLKDATAKYKFFTKLFAACDYLPGTTNYNYASEVIAYWSNAATMQNYFVTHSSLMPNAAITALLSNSVALKLLVLSQSLLISLRNNSYFNNNLLTSQILPSIIYDNFSQLGAGVSYQYIPAVGNAYITTYPIYQTYSTTLDTVLSTTANVTARDELLKYTTAYRNYVSVWDTQNSYTQYNQKYVNMLSYYGTTNTNRLKFFSSTAFLNVMSQQDAISYLYTTHNTEWNNLIVDSASLTAFYNTNPSYFKSVTKNTNITSGMGTLFASFIGATGTTLTTMQARSTFAAVCGNATAMSAILANSKMRTLLLGDTTYIQAFISAGSAAAAAIAADSEILTYYFSAGGTAAYTTYKNSTSVGAAFNTVLGTNDSTLASQTTAANVVANSLTTICNSTSANRKYVLEALSDLIGANTTYLNQVIAVPAALQDYVNSYTCMLNLGHASPTSASTGYQSTQPRHAFMANASVKPLLKNSYDGMRGIIESGNGWDGNTAYTCWRGWISALYFIWTDSTYRTEAVGRAMYKCMGSSSTGYVPRFSQYNFLVNSAASGYEYFATAAAGYALTTYSISSNGTWCSSFYDSLISNLPYFKQALFDDIKDITVVVNGVTITPPQVYSYYTDPSTTQGTKNYSSGSYAYSALSMDNSFSYDNWAELLAYSNNVRNRLLGWSFSYYIYGPSGSTADLLVGANFAKAIVKNKLAWSMLKTGSYYSNLSGTSTIYNATFRNNIINSANVYRASNLTNYNQIKPFIGTFTIVKIVQYAYTSAVSSSGNKFIIDNATGGFTTTAAGQSNSLNLAASTTNIDTTWREITTEMYYQIQYVDYDIYYI